MREDQERWNTRFNKRPLVQPSTPRFMKEKFDQLIPGTVLDLACGDGAATLYLAEKGLKVTATDISDIALARLSIFAKALSLDVSTCLVDFDHPTALSHLGAFDNIVIMHFKPKPVHWPIIVSLLRPGGKLLMSTFNLQHHFENNFSRRFCLEKNELIHVSEDLVLDHHESVNINGNYMDDYIFHKACTP